MPDEERKEFSSLPAADIKLRKYRAFMQQAVNILRSCGGDLSEMEFTLEGIEDGPALQLYYTFNPNNVPPQLLPPQLWRFSLSREEARHIPVDREQIRELLNLKADAVYDTLSCQLRLGYKTVDMQMSAEGVRFQHGVKSYMQSLHEIQEVPVKVCATADEFEEALIAAGCFLDPASTETVKQTIGKAFAKGAAPNPHISFSGLSP